VSSSNSDTSSKPGPLVPTFDESLQGYFKRCGVSEQDKDRARALHAFWHACLTAQYVEWKARGPIEPFREDVMLAGNAKKKP
jgi:hypothetical protein